MKSTFRRSAEAPVAQAAPAPSETLLTISDEEHELVPRVLRALEQNCTTAAAATASGERPPPLPPAETVVRFLRARSGDVEAAARMLTAAAALPPPPQPCPRCLEDHRAHSFYPVGPTVRGEPVTYSNYLATDTDPADNVNHMRYAMDSLFHDASLHRMTWVMDMHGFSRKHLSPSVARRVLTLFADHYPERLGCAIIYDAPYVFHGLFSAVKVFADPVTVRKVVFIKHSLSDRRSQFEHVGIKGECLDKLLVEIDEARDPAVIREKNWWAAPPLPPLPHYGLPFDQHAAK